MTGNRNLYSHHIWRIVTIRLVHSQWNKRQPRNYDDDDDDFRLV